MTMRLITARRTSGNATLAVHLDTTKVDGQGNPNPTYVLTRTWRMPKRQGGETVQQYAARMAPWVDGIKADMRTLCQGRLAELEEAADPGTALPGEGEEL